MAPCTAAPTGHARSPRTARPVAGNGRAGSRTGAATSDPEGGAPERSPGLPDIYQADDLSLPAFVLGLEGLPTEPLHTRQAELRARREDPDEPADPDDRPTREHPPSTADDADPLPGRQDPDEGVL